MSIINTVSSIPRSAVIYVTVGALTVVWSGIWYVYVLNDPTRGETTSYWCYGFLLTGLTLMLIGLAIAWVARIRPPSRNADMPREELSSDVASAEPIAPSTAPILAAAIPAGAPGAIGSNHRSPSSLKPAYQSRNDGG